MQLVFKERDNYLKKNCNFFVKYDISKLDDLIETLESLTSELKWKLNKNVLTPLARLQRKQFQMQIRGTPARRLEQQQS